MMISTLAVAALGTFGAMPPPAAPEVEAAMPLGAWQVGLAIALVLAGGAVSVALQLGLERRLLVASVRTVVQLLLIGYVLHWVFARDDWRVVLALMAAMSLIAGVAAVGRVERRYRGIRLDSIVSVWASSWIVTGIALGGIVQPSPWYKPQYAIPLLGMILGNTLNGIALGMDRLGQELDARRAEVETLLALGATRWEAARPCVQNAVRTGMIPIINSMMVVGLVSLPGMMTGQMISGASPMEAVKYQIVIMFLIAAGASLGTVGVVLLGYRRLFSRHHQFLARKLVADATRG
jgi:putative ABC transport system permease protein